MGDEAALVPPAEDPKPVPPADEAPAAESPKPFDLHATLKAQFAHLKE